MGLEEPEKSGMVRRELRIGTEFGEDPLTPGAFLSFRRGDLRVLVGARPFPLEEDGDAFRWESALAEFRRRVAAETNDPILVAYIVVFAVSLLLFLAGIGRTGHPAELLIGAAFGVPFALVSRAWLAVYPRVADAYAAEWRTVKKTMVKVREP